MPTASFEWKSSSNLSGLYIRRQIRKCFAVLRSFGLHGRETMCIPCQMWLLRQRLSNLLAVFWDLVEIKEREDGWLRAFLFSRDFNVVVIIKSIIIIIRLIIICYCYNHHHCPCYHYHRFYHYLYYRYCNCLYKYECFVVAFIDDQLVNNNKDTESHLPCPRSVGKKNAWWRHSFLTDIAMATTGGGHNIIREKSEGQGGVKVITTNLH